MEYPVAQYWATFLLKIYMNINFSYNKEKDVLNYQIINSTSLKGGASGTLNRIVTKYGEVNPQTIDKFINSYSSYNNFNFEDLIERLNIFWRDNSVMIEKRFDNIFNTRISNEISVYITTNDRCAYSFDEKFFFVSITGESPKRTILHELLHFYTIQKFQEQFKLMKREDAYKIKESLTELLNWEFTDLIEVPDQGYTGHQDLRQIIKNTWPKEKNIENIFELLSKQLD